MQFRKIQHWLTFNGPIDSASLPMADNGKLKSIFECLKGVEPMDLLLYT
jgi:hypothetical protein